MEIKNYLRAFNHNDNQLQDVGEGPTPEKSYILNIFQKMDNTESDNSFISLWRGTHNWYL
jgi:hypothetical protein